MQFIHASVQPAIANLVGFNNRTYYWHASRENDSLTRSLTRDAQYFPTSNITGDSGHAKTRNVGVTRTKSRLKARCVHFKSANIMADCKIDRTFHYSDPERIVCNVCDKCICDIIRGLWCTKHKQAVKAYYTCEDAHR